MVHKTVVQLLDPPGSVNGRAFYFAPCCPSKMVSFCFTVVRHFVLSNQLLYFIRSSTAVLPVIHVHLLRNSPQFLSSVVVVSLMSFFDITTAICNFDNRS